MPQPHPPQQTKASPEPPRRLVKHPEIRQPRIVASPPSLCPLRDPDPRPLTQRSLDEPLHRHTHNRHHRDDGRVKLQAPPECRYRSTIVALEEQDKTCGGCDAGDGVPVFLLPPGGRGKISSSGAGPCRLFSSGGVGDRDMLFLDVGGEIDGFEGDIGGAVHDPSCTRRVWGPGDSAGRGHVGERARFVDPGIHICEVRVLGGGHGDMEVG
ncbi:hypothetical protein B0H67DRAFT_69885 [Lasiosphaeris hirsuta]|uniref:Uncharacterized protein n=1 Tax=Lasiosphaeris hirsuta TaxID=260670 RepID=A0AA40BC18_9PEZI|nr:hypothetical protein B0H67DRAFT_69885 [Lasiosphaeris hirsuta]